MTTCEKVVEILVSNGGFRVLPTPFNIGSLAFDFSHALIGGEKSNDLVLVIELSSGTDDADVIRKVFALTRALDVLRSRRSVTVVLTMGQALPDTVRSLSRVCRVLAVGSPSGPNAEQELIDWLSVLLPLSLPTPVDDSGEWESEVRNEISKESDEGFVRDLLRLSEGGKQVVERHLRIEIEKAMSGPLDEELGGN
ncbi:hypothetical protein ROA7450_03861 [Roseovarius albus]|uniref:Uncharacterized protein n=1 Tax=Roseovarius albus TaxID=1247867 RepID=A0A1X7A501_9RHOB|nr:hypothetical protein [Roseovarius albus]SLN70799.1 hypothetical protein ROA7450_03861 [Roseovarius albus]